MSASMLRRGLALLSDDAKEDGKGGAGGGGGKKAQQTPSKAKAMRLVSTNRQGVTRQVRRLQGRLGPGRSKATVKDKRTKNALEEFRKTQGKDHLADNLAYFLASSFTPAEAVTKKILRQHEGRQARNRPDVPVKKPAEAAPVFTEEEFQKFQKEYFGE